ncbi:hypothetical protein M8J77_021084 [Diaphorina citri]|nr:hypothetical protein M8J77_021084 [Diaphorina citri]
MERRRRGGGGEDDENGEKEEEEKKEKKEGRRGRRRRKDEGEEKEEAKTRLKIVESLGHTATNQFIIHASNGVDKCQSINTSNPSILRIPSYQGRIQDFIEKPKESKQ